MVNVIDTGSRNDLYEIAAKAVIKAIKTSESPKAVKNRPNLLKIQINRSVMKIPVMTIPYNISLNGVSEKLIELLVQEKSYNKADKTYNYKIRPEFCINNESVILNSSEFGELSAFIFNSLYNIAPLLKELVNYFNASIKSLYNIGKPVIWITPAGMTINLSYF